MTCISFFLKKNDVYFFMCECNVFTQELFFPSLKKNELFFPFDNFSLHGNLLDDTHKFHFHELQPSQ